MRALNLASRPVRNEALPSLLFYVAASVALALTVKHAFVFRGLLPDRTSALHAEVAKLDAEATRLRSEEGALRGPAPDPLLVARWSELKDLVDRRTFSWTRLLASLERVVPEGVRISSIVPNVRKGDIRLDISAQAQSTDAGFEFMKRLQQRPEFEEPVPVSIADAAQEGDGAKEFRYAMLYRPDAAPAEEPADAAKAPDEEQGADETEVEP